jgi:hypothetical protein
MAFGGLLWMAEIWRELALSVGCRSSQTFERNQCPITGSPQNIPKGENLHQKVITFGIVIRLRNAPIHFLSSLRTRNFNPAVNEDDEIALRNEASRMTKTPTLIQRKRVANEEQVDSALTVRVTSRNSRML